MSLAYRADLQGLRAIAIALVVCAHAGVPGLAGGFVGVDVFFVLSGYLITGLLLSEHRSSGRICWSAFVARRLKRLLPALLVMVLVSGLLGLLLLSNHEFVEQTASAAYALSWTSNLFFAFEQFDYFAELHNRDLFLHTWSLGVEEQFYLFWPWVLMFLLVVAGRPGKGAEPRVPLLLGLGVLFVTSLSLSLYWSSGASLWAFYLTPARVWQFALGAGVFVWLDHRTALPSRTVGRARTSGALLLVAGLLLVFGSAVYLTPAITYPDVWALLPSLGAATIIAAGPTAGGRLLSRPLLVWVGDRSYSWYLWHWPMLMFGFAWGLKNDPLALPAVVLCSLGMAMLSYRYVELPFWRGRWSGWRPGVTVSSAVLSAGLAAAILLSMHYLQRDDMGRGETLARAARNDMPVIYKDSDCDRWFHDSNLHACEPEPRQATKTAVIVGDSVGVQWFPFLTEMFRSPDWRVVAFTKSSCAIVDHDYDYSAAGGRYQVCTDWRNALIERLIEMQPDVLFIGSAAYPFNREQWVGGTRVVLDRLDGAVGQIFLLPGTPRLSFDGPGCLARWLGQQGAGASASPGVCGEPRGGDAASRIAGFLREAVAAYPNVRLLNLNDLVCPDDFCSAWSAGNLVVFRDQQHLTASFVRAQTPHIRQRLRSLGLDVSVDD